MYVVNHHSSKDVSMFPIPQIVYICAWVPEPLKYFVVSVLRDAPPWRWPHNWQNTCVVYGVCNMLSYTSRAFVDSDLSNCSLHGHGPFKVREINPLNPELNPICYLLALLGAYHFLHVSRIRVKLLTFRLLMSHIYIYGASILDVSRSHTTTQHSR